MTILAWIILLVWGCVIIYFLFFRNKVAKPILQAASVGTGSDKPQPSPLLKEHTIRLEDGSFGMRIEFLKQDVDFEELLQAGKQVFELKKFIQEARDNKNKALTKSSINPEKVEDEPIANNFDIEPEYPEIDDPNFNDLPIVVTGDEIFEAEKYKLPDTSGLIDINKL